MQKYLIILLASLIFTSCGEGVVIVDGPPKTETVILAVGDSLTAGYGLSVSDSYPSQLETRLREMGYRYSVQNAGVSGDTTAGLLTRMDWLLE